MQILPEDDGAESISLLSNLANVDSDTARRVFRKHGGDMNKAAEALLSGDLGEDAWNPRHTTPERSFYDTDAPPIQVVPAPSGSVIDLTGEGEGYKSGENFGPSTRAPHPDWQIVPSDLPVGSTPGISHEDQTLNDAIQASLNDFKEDTEPFPFKETVREGGRPVALRPETPSLACAALVVQALSFVPQVRSAVGQLCLPDIEDDTPQNHPARAIWNLIELFTNMDLAQLAAIVDVEVLPSLENEEDRDKLGENPSERAAAMVGNLGRAIDAHLSAQQKDNDFMSHLFEFTHVSVELNNRLPRKVARPSKGGVCRIEVGGDSPDHDLISSLSSILSRYEENKSFHDVIVEPSEMIAFHIVRHPPTNSSTTTTKADPDPFTFPKSFHLDPFLFRNLEITNRKKAKDREIDWETKELKGQRTTFTRFNQRDSLQDLKNSIYYYEHVSEANGDLSRRQMLQQTLDQLKDILMMIESKVEAIDHKVQDLEKEASVLFDCPELQQHPYDLRAVLMHTGLPGRKQLYSYVRDSDGTWWKTCDYEVTEVQEETVLNDSAGLHLSAGAFLLLYSKHLSDEELRRPVAWPRIFADPVEENNKQFLALLPPEIAAKAKVRRSPTPLTQAATPPRAGQYLQPLRSGSMGPRPPPRSRTMDMTVD